jgi:trimethylamine:corrinoid methyltransferase-like protein
MLLDAEIRDFVTQAVGDFATDEDAFTIDVIRQCAEAGDFMASEDTASRYRNLAWAGRLFDYDMLNAWLESDRRTDRARLTEMVADLTSRDMPPVLDEDRQRAVMAVYERARSTVT